MSCLVVNITQITPIVPGTSNSQPRWFEGEDIVSVSEIWTKKEGNLVESTALKIPYKVSVKIDHMHTRVITAAKATAQVLKLSHLLPATVDDVVDAYWNMADSLAADMENSQVHFAVMYHAIIIRAALRVMNSARKTEDVCQVSPDYEYTESSSLFICTQDLPQLPHVIYISLLPHKSQQRGSLDSIGRSVPDDVDEQSGSGDKQIRPTAPIPSIPNDPKAGLNIRVDIRKGS